MIGKKVLWKSLPVVATLFVGGSARADDCVLGANAVVLVGSSAMGAVVKATAGALLAQGNIDVFYYAPGSCSGVDAITLGTDLVGKSADHYDASGNKTSCTLPAGAKADLAVSDVFAEVCPSGKPAGFGDFTGFMQSMLFVVPKMSTQTAIVAEEGYFVFGAGTAGYQGMTVAPWTDQAKFAIRNQNSGTQQMIARALKLSATAMKGMDSGGTGGVVTALTSAGTSPTTAEPAIGIMSSDAYDAARTNLKSLAFQGFGQKHAYYADSTATSFDKRNVRDGHYVIWGPLHMIAKIDGTGKATRSQVQDLIDYVQLKKPLGTLNLIDIMARANVVPECAMKVTRTSEMGPLSLVTRAAGTACGCYFEEKVKAGSSGCKACTMNSDCSDGKSCSNGYCE